MKMRIVAGVLFLVSLSFAGADALAMTDDWSGTAMRFVDPLIGTEGGGSEYGGMQPYTKVETLDAKPYLTRMGCVHLLRANVHVVPCCMIAYLPRVYLLGANIRHGEYMKPKERTDFKFKRAAPNLSRRR